MAHTPTTDPATGLIEFAGDLYEPDAWAWVCEARDRSHLVPEKRRDKNGHMRTVFVRKDRATKSPAKDTGASAAHATAVSADIGDPSKLTPERLKSLPADLAKLSVPQLEALNAKHGAGGDAKAHLVAKLTAHAKRKAPAPPPGTAAAPLAGAGKDAAEHLSTLIDGFKGGKTPKAAVDAGLAKLSKLDAGQAHAVARDLKVDAGLKPNASKATAVKHVAAAVVRIHKTSQNVNH